MSNVSDTQLDDISSSLYKGRKIEAIKLYREYTNTGLAEAKDFVESLDHELRTKYPEKFTFQKASGCATAAMFIISVVYLFLQK